MISEVYLARWRTKSNWSESYQVEQDLILHRADLEQNLFLKLTDDKFLNDITTLLPKNINYFAKIDHYKQLFYEKIITRISGEPWKCDFTRCLASSSILSSVP